MHGKRKAHCKNEGLLYEMKAVDRLFFVKYNGIKWYVMVECNFLSCWAEKHWYKMSCKYYANVFFMGKNTAQRHNVSSGKNFIGWTI